MIALLFSILLTLSPASDVLRVSQPFPVLLPQSAVLSWTSFDDLTPSPNDGKIQVLADTALQARGRIDIFARLNGEWILWSTHRYIADEITLQPSEYTRGVLLRFEESAVYQWAEVSANKVTTVHLKSFKTIAVTAPANSDSFALFVSGEVEPRSAARKSHQVFNMVPLLPTLLCRVERAAACVLLPSESSVASMPEDGVPIRLLRAPAQTGEHFVVKAKGRFSFHPKIIASTILRAPPWAAVELTDSRYSWNDVVIDWSGEVFATERIQGAWAAELPVFTEIRARIERGVVIRPKVRSLDHPLNDPSAVLLVSPAPASAISSTVPLVIAYSDQNGTIALPHLGTGSYQFKLLSIATTGQPQMATVTAGQTYDVVFESGAAIIGRVALTSGGTASDPVLIEVAPDLSIAAALNDSDLGEKIRAAIADPDGRFRVVLGAPGRYRVRARWGAATGEREIELRDNSSEVDIGVISLRRGATLHGSLTDCADGEIAVIPVPDFSRSFTTGVGEVRRGRVGGDGRFAVEGLKQGGACSLGARTNGSISCRPLCPSRRAVTQS